MSHWPEWASLSVDQQDEILQGIIVMSINDCSNGFVVDEVMYQKLGHILGQILKFK